MAVSLWGLEAIKSKGESLGLALALVGAEPVVEATGRVVRFELVPLEILGRPRIDVLASLSGIFRDSFAHVVMVGGEKGAAGVSWLPLPCLVLSYGAFPSFFLNPRKGLPICAFFLNFSKMDENLGSWFKDGGKCGLEKISRRLL